MRAIPEKRFDTTLISYLSQPETDALLAAPDRSTWTGRRDHALLLLAVQTGLRATELANLRCQDLQLEDGAYVRCWGQGLVARRAASVITRHGRWRATVACGVQQEGFHESSLDGWVDWALLFESRCRYHAARPSCAAGCAEWRATSPVRQPSPTQLAGMLCCLRGSGRTRSLDDHPELVGHLDAVVETVAKPDHIEPGRAASAYAVLPAHGGPSRWLMAVVSYEQQPARIITALANRKDPKRWKP